MIRSYYRVFANNVAISLTYRWNIITGMATQSIKLLTTLFIWRSIFFKHAVIQGYTVKDMTTYLIISSLLGVTFSVSHSFRLSGLVRRGTLNTYLIRPYSFLGDSFAVFIGGKIIELFLSSILIIVLLTLKIIVINQITCIDLLLVLSNFILLFTFGSLVGTFSFWFIEMWPIKPLYGSMMALFGGALFPLDLLPVHVREIFVYSPFSLFGFVNAKALQGQLSESEVFHFLIASFSWIVISSITYSFLWNKGLKRYEGVNA